MSKPKVPEWMRRSGSHADGRRIWESVLEDGQEFGNVIYIEGETWVELMDGDQITRQQLRELADLIDSCQEPCGRCDGTGAVRYPGTREQDKLVTPCPVCKRRGRNHE